MDDFSRSNLKTYRMFEKKRDSQGSKKRGLSTASLVLIYILIAFFNQGPLFAVSAVDPNVDFLVIDYPAAHSTNQYNPVPFTHKKHYVDYEIPCRGCHHAWKLEIRENPVKCMECHKGKKSSEAVLLRNAFHRCCMNCHRDMKKGKKPTGPVKCKRCHIILDTGQRRSK